jgi:hypothetical protein
MMAAVTTAVICSLFSPTVSATSAMLVYVVPLPWSRG